jgi:hypothetical protein
LFVKPDWKFLLLLNRASLLHSRERARERGGVKAALLNRKNAPKFRLVPNPRIYYLMAGFGG